jgi:hypothetical protein
MNCMNNSINNICTRNCLGIILIPNWEFEFEEPVFLSVGSTWLLVSEHYKIYLLLYVYFYVNVVVVYQQYAVLFIGSQYWCYVSVRAYGVATMFIVWVNDLLEEE